MAKGGINRTIEIPQPSIFGRIGTGIGKGLSEQLPKEIERGRLKRGLEELSKEKNLTPFQQFSRLLTLPGMTPQGIQSGGDILRQQALLNSAYPQNQRTDISQLSPADLEKSNTPPESSITTKQGVYNKLNPYIPPTEAQKHAMAQEFAKSNPGLSYDQSRNFIDRDVQSKIEQSNAQIEAENLKQDVQTKAESELAKEIATIGANVPGTLMSRLQKEAIQKVRDKELTERDASMEIGKKATSLSKGFANINSWGGLDLITNKPKDLFAAVNATRQKMKENDALPEMAEDMVAKNGLTPTFAYSLTYPVSEIPELNNILKKLPEMSRIPHPGKLATTAIGGLASAPFSGMLFDKNLPSEKVDEATRKIAPELFEAMGTKGSPLSVAYELEKKGYNPDIWKEFLNENRKKLTGEQQDQLEKTDKNFQGFLNDWWFKSFTGIK